MLEANIKEKIQLLKNAITTRGYEFYQFTNLVNIKNLLVYACQESKDLKKVIDVLFHINSVSSHLFIKRDMTATKLLPKEIINGFVKVSNIDYKAEDYPADLWEPVKNDEESNPEYKLFLLKEKS